MATLSGPTRKVWKENNKDLARQERFYLPRLKPPEDDESSTARSLGLDRPESNYFMVPFYWTHISANIRSEILIIVMEYFFRHGWGWQVGAREIRWLDTDDLADGRRYRSEERQEERYDRGIGYIPRKIRDALDEGVSRGLLVWRQVGNGREFALRMTWMEGVGADGYYDPNDPDLDQSVGGKDQSVDRTYIDTSNQTLPLETGKQTKTIHPPLVIENGHNGHVSTETVKEIRSILVSGGLTSGGLQHLCQKSPPLDPGRVRAVLLYAEAHNLGPGYIFRCLDSDAPIDELYLRGPAHITWVLRHEKCNWGWNSLKITMEG